MRQLTPEEILYLAPRIGIATEKRVKQVYLMTVAEKAEFDRRVKENTESLVAEAKDEIEDAWKQAIKRYKEESEAKEA